MSHLKAKTLNVGLEAKRAKITLGCLLFIFQCTTTDVSRTYNQVSEQGLALIMLIPVNTIRN